MPLLPNFDSLRLLQNFGLANATTGQLHPPPYNVAAKTGNYTILRSDPCGTLFTNRGAAGAVVFTLPAPGAVPSGTYYDFAAVIATQTLTVATATADTLITFNDLTADSVGIATANEIIGGAMRFVTDGTSWVAIGLSKQTTFTITT